MNRARHRHGETGIVELTWAGAPPSFRNRSTPELARRKPPEQPI